MWPILQVIAVHEDILPSRMTVQIAVQCQIALFTKLSYEFLYSKYDWMDDTTWRFPPPVEILPRQGASVVSIDDTIRVKNGHYLKYEVVSQSLCLRRLADKVLYASFHHPGSIALTRMHSCTNKDSLFSQSLRTFWIFVFARNRQIFALVAS